MTRPETCPGKPYETRVQGRVINSTGHLETESLVAGILPYWALWIPVVSLLGLDLSVCLSVCLKGKDPSEMGQGKKKKRQFGTYVV